MLSAKNRDKKYREPVPLRHRINEFVFMKRYCFVCLFLSILALTKKKNLRGSERGKHTRNDERERVKNRAEKLKIYGIV